MTWPKSGSDSDSKPNPIHPPPLPPYLPTHRPHPLTRPSTHSSDTYGISDAAARRPAELQRPIFDSKIYPQALTDFHYDS